MAKSKTNTVHALELLAERKNQPEPVMAVVGDEPFLTHAVRNWVIDSVGSSDEPDVEVLDGKTAELRDVLDAVSERSLFGSGTRVVVVAEADPLVKQHRDRLEDYAARPRVDALLVLEVSTLPGNTRLAKAIQQSGLVVRCQTPSSGREVKEHAAQLKRWLVAVAGREHDAELEAAAAERLIELLPPAPGLLFQEVARLALLAGESRRIDTELVGKHVGGWRARKTWDMIDAATDGRSADALAQLDRLLRAGEEAHAILPQLASRLRKFAAATRLFEEGERAGRRPSLRQALTSAGFPPFKIDDAQRQLRQLGRGRAARLNDWVLAADLQLKDYNSTKDRARRVLETLIVQLSDESPAPVAGELLVPAAW
ncbi:MAG: DNA polymerase III subunit delta [Planctomycetota bacterium]